jgi:hypothetical protein
MKRESRVAMAAIHRHFLHLRGVPSVQDKGRPGSRGLWWTVDPWLRGLPLAARNWIRYPGQFRLLHQIPRFIAQFRVDPDAYFRYSLHRDWKRRADYVFHDEIVAVLNDVNSRVSAADTSTLSDKRAFSERCRDAGLPTIPTLAEFENGACREVDCGNDFASRDLFSKFANRYCGEGAAHWRCEGTRYRNGDALLTLPELKALLASRSSHYPIILQPRVANHADLMPVSGNGLSTVRIITIRNRDDAPQVALACYRMPTGQSVVDNFAAGGIAAGVNLDTGVLTTGVVKTDFVQRILRHPDSGASIAELALPYWRDVCDLAVSAHRTFPSMVSVGWDVAITPGGPILVEGNAVWCVDLAQMSAAKPLADTPIPACLSQYLGSASSPAGLAPMNARHELWEPHG